MLQDHEFDPVSPEEQARREAEAELARRIRREVRRMERGEADDDLREAEEERRRKAARRASSTFWQLVSGTILLRRGVSQYYPYMACIAGMFLLSIMVMFWSLHLDMKYSRLEREVQLLRERSIRLEEQRFSRTTHSAVVEELRRRGIDLQDPPAPGEIIDN